MESKIKNLPVIALLISPFFLLTLLATCAWEDNLHAGKVARARGESSKYYMAIVFYHKKFRTIPKSINELFEKEYHDVKNFLEKNDPWGNRYKYIPQGKTRFQIVSWGDDGKEGGKNRACDLVYSYRIVSKK